MPDKSLPSLFERHWAESALAIGAIVIAAFSLWVAVDTERTNHQMVAAASWPMLQESVSDATYSGQHLLTVKVTNSGIGPAKVGSVQVSWHGKFYRSALGLLHACCGLSPRDGSPSALITSTLFRRVMRAGQTVTLIYYPYPAKDPGPWRKFQSIIESRTQQPKFTICYCSAFNQCWVTDGHRLNPQRVASCPTPKVVYE